MRTLALLLFATATTFAQCTMDGTVVSISGVPVERAHISITIADDTFFADSDVAGKWTMEHIPCGPVTINANRPGFLNKQTTATAPAHDLKLQLAPQAVLAGRVLDEQGDPILGAQVSLMTSRVINGLRGTQASTSAIANDLGEYRFSGLAAGKYSICASAGGGAIAGTGARTYGEKCYPGSTPMDVAAGYEGRVDLTLTPLTTVRVSGIVSGQSGNSSVSLVPREQIARMSLGLLAQVKPDGSFVIRHVPPGSYNAIVSSGRNWTVTPVEVASAEIDSLQLHIEPGATVTGAVKPALTGVDIRLQRDFNGAFSQPAEWNSDGTVFTLSDIPSGNYRVQLTGPNPPFYVRSITVENRDISNSTFLVAPGVGNIEVLLADDGGTVEGDASEPAWVLIQKDGVSSRNTRTDEKGHFKIDTLPPGDYKVYAWDDNTNVEYANPDWMRQNAKGESVTVTPKQTAHVTVTRQIAPAQ